MVFRNSVEPAFCATFDADQETEQIRKEGEAIRQEVSELTATNHLLKEQTEALAEDKEKLLSENENGDCYALYFCGKWKLGVV